MSFDFVWKEPFQLNIVIFYLEKPKLAAITASKLVMAGNLLNIEVKVSGCNDPCVTWQHQGGPLTSDVFVKAGHGTSRLLVRQALVRHSGTYTVIAECKEGKVQLDFPVKVVGEYNIHNTRIND